VHFAVITTKWSSSLSNTRVKGLSQHLIFVWNKQLCASSTNNRTFFCSVQIEVNLEDTVEVLKYQIFSLLDVPPEQQFFKELPNANVILIQFFRIYIFLTCFL
jgi:hypothetical protein